MNGVQRGGGHPIAEPREHPGAEPQRLAADVGPEDLDDDQVAEAGKDSCRAQTRLLQLAAGRPHQLTEAIAAVAWANHQHRWETELQNIPGLRPVLESTAEQLALGPVLTDPETIRVVRNQVPSDAVDVEARSLSRRGQLMLDAAGQEHDVAGHKFDIAAARMEPAAS